MIPILRSVLRRSFDGEAWHGPSLSEALTGIDARTAAARPVAGGHTIWELTHHVAAWTREVTRRLAGAAAAMPEEGDWPPPVAEPDPEALEAAWAHLRAELTGARDALLAAVADFPPERLGERVGPTPDAALGTRASFGGMLIGLAEHNAYHGGQLVLLRRAAAGRPEGSPPLPTEREPTAPAAESISES
jgi:uncharacterized damage-inducible protein DinB